MKRTLVFVFFISVSCPVYNFSLEPSTSGLSNEEILKSRESPDSVSRSNAQSKYCRKPAKCETLKYSTCYGVRLPYTSTSLTHITDVENQDDVQKKLSKWKELMHIPRCWSVVQPFLCALYMPKCENNSIDLPSKEMCEKIQSPCSILQTDDLWPSEFRCNVSYETTCDNDVRDLKFNTAGECKAPLIKAIDEASFYEGVEGCAIPCHDPFFTDEERQNIRFTIKYSSIISCICSAFAVVTYLLTRPFATKFPAQAVFWMNLCFLMVSLGFLWQFLGSNDRTICRADGTLRTMEPSRENLSCVANFVVVYSFLVAGIMWCIVFAYTWMIRSQTYDKIRNRRDPWSPYYHIVSWSVPLVLTVIIAALQAIDGDGLLGICFVGVVNKNMRIIFLLGPVIVLTIAGGFLVICISKLIYLKTTSEEVISKHVIKKIHESIYKLIFFLLSIIVFMSVTIYCQYYEWKHHHMWKKSFRSYVVCRFGVVGNVPPEDCRMQNRPNVSLIQVQLWAISIFSVAVASWIFTAWSASRQTWKRFIAETLLGKEFEETTRLKKYKVIARAYEKRKCLESDSDGRISIDLCRSYQDPVDLDFDLNSVGSKENSSWVQMVPNLLKRRAGITPALHSHSNSSQWKNSTDSEISFSVRRVSVESRRNSLESTVSVQAVEFKETVTRRPRSKRRRKHRKRTRSCSSDTSAMRYGGTGGPTIHDTDLEAEVMKALNIGPIHAITSQKPVGRSMTNRRMALTGIEQPNITWFRQLSIKKLLNGSQSESEGSPTAASEGESDPNDAIADMNLVRNMEAHDVGKEVEPTDLHDSDKQSIQAV